MTSKTLEKMSELNVAEHLILLPVGLYCFVNQPTPGALHNGGLPRVRISPPPDSTGNVEISGFQADGWLSGAGDAALVRVSRGPTKVLFKTYQMSNVPDAAPKLQIRQLIGAASAPAIDVALLAEAQVKKPVTTDIIVHIQARGDVSASYGC